MVVAFTVAFTDVESTSGVSYTVLLTNPCVERLGNWSSGTSAESIFHSYVLLSKEAGQANVDCAVLSLLLENTSNCMTVVDETWRTNTQT